MLWDYYVPRRVIIGIALMMSFVFANIQRSCVSMAIIPISRQNKWTETMEGMVLSAFGFGYMSSQFFGVYFAKKFGAKITVALAVGTPGLFVMLFPFTVKYPLLSFFCLYMVGLCQGPLWPGYWGILRAWFPQREISTINAFINLGAMVGIIISFGLSPLIYEVLNWESSFFIYGSLTLFWSISWILISKSSPLSVEDVSVFSVSASEMELFQEIVENSSISVKGTPIPWKNIVFNRVVICLGITQFCNNWNWYITNAWIPTYFAKGLNFDLKETGYLSILPYIFFAFVIQFAGISSDYLISHQILSKNWTRKIMQSISFSSLIIMYCFIGFWQGLSPDVIVVLVTIGLPLMGISGGGLNPCYADISIEYSGAMHSVTNTFGTIPAAAGIYIVGFILDVSHNNWSIIWLICLGFSVMGVLAYVFGVDLSPIDFNVKEEESELLLADFATSPRKYNNA